MSRIKELITLLKEKYQTDYEIIKTVIAPGRINIIGGHTDYNNGLVLPFAIDLNIMFVAGANNTNIVNLYSTNFSNSNSFSLENFKKDNNNWGNYPKGICRFLSRNEYKLSGINGIINGILPIKCGLASSAALEIGIAFLFKLIFNLNISPINLVKIAYNAERKYVGVKCGIMDQFVCVYGKENHSLLIDCKSLKYEYRRMPKGDIIFLIIHTNIDRDSSIALNKRKKECYEAVQIFKKYDASIESLRDVSIDFYNKCKKNLPSILQKRCNHIIHENERVLYAAEALKSGDIEELGKLMLQSHQSLSNFYNVSCDELDIIFKILKNLSGVLGVRMTGAGFGGSLIALVEDAKIDRVKTTIFNKYLKITNKKPSFFNVNVSNGVSEIKV
jgi:galactokinase